VKLADILFSLLSVCGSVCLSVRAHSVQSSTVYGIATRRWRLAANANKYRPIVTTLWMRP